MTEHEFDDDTVLIMDDDIHYHPETWKNLVTLYDPNRTDTIYASKCVYYDSECYLIWSGCGLLIPPHTLRFDKHILDDGFNALNSGGLNYLNDDNYISAYCRKQNIKCVTSDTKQRYLDFEGNKKLMVAHYGKCIMFNKFCYRYFNLTDSDRITVSTTQTDPKRIKALFDNQTLKPDKIIVTVKPNTDIPNGIKTIPNVTIQYDDDPNTKRFTPDTDPDDLVFLIPDTDIPDNLIERMFTRYYQSNDGYTHVQPVRFTHVPDLGHKPAPDMSHAVFRRRHADNMPNDPTPETFIRTIITNLRRGTTYQQPLTT